MAFSPDGQLLASGSDDNMVKLWEIQRVENQPPQAEFRVSPSQPRLDQSVQFDASESSDPDGEITDYSWEFGDGASGSGEMVTHTYGESGSFTVTLTVTDDDGATDATSRTIQVEAEPAFFALSELSVSPSSPEVGEDVAIWASVRNTGGQEASQPIRLLVDGSEEDQKEIRLDAGVKETVRFYHSFASGGRHTVALRSDDDRLAREVDVAESNEPPDVHFSYAPAEPVKGHTVSFDASKASDPDDEIVEYEWAFGDGTSAEGETAEHTFSEAGTYTVELTVTDDDGASASMEKEVEVLESGGSGGPA